jgi:ABC-type transporter Mla subunit MlaD
MFGLATSAKQDLILSQQATIMVDITTLTAAVAAHAATVQKLVDLVQPAATELTALRSDLAAVDPALATLAASLAAQKPALDAAVATLQGIVAGPAAA